MKKSYLIGALALIAALAIVVSASQDVSTYATFDDAGMNSSRVKIAGSIDKDHDIEYDPINTPNAYVFHMKDSDGDSKKVIVKMPKPQDFEMSETVVVTGKMNEEDVFIASDIQLKCPSKYKDEELKLRAEANIPS